MLAEFAHAVRSIRRRPASPLAGVATLAAGVALGGVIFALADPYLAKPLPYRDAANLVGIEILQDFGPVSSLREDRIPSLLDWQRRTDLLDGLAAYTDRQLLRVRLGSETVPFQAYGVSDNFLGVLGVVGGANPVPGEGAVWIARDAARRTPSEWLSAGRTIPLLPSGAITVAGVLPASFHFPGRRAADETQALLVVRPGPLATIDHDHGGTRVSPLHLIGRLHPGVSAFQVENALNASLGSSGFTVSVRPLPAVLKERFQDLALGALSASLLVFVVCAANVAGIALTRGLYRVRELAMLETLGATRARVLQLLSAEAAAVGSAGALLGAACIAVLLPVVVATMPVGFTSLGQPEVTGRVVGFAGICGAIGAVGWLCGSLGAWRANGFRGSHAMRGDGAAARTLQFLSLASQVAAAGVLLAGAVLLGRSYLNLTRTDPGVDPRSISLTVSYPSETTSARLRDAMDRTVEALSHQPGVAAVGVSIGGGVDRLSADALVFVEGRPVFVARTDVDRGFFEAAGVRFIQGGPAAGGSGRTVVINRTLASRAFPNGRAVGQLLRVGGSSALVTGVVQDVRDRGLAVAPPPAVFLPTGDVNAKVPIIYSLRCRAELTRVPAEWARIVQRVDSGAVVLDASAMQERLNRSVRDRSFATVVMIVFAAATILVSIVGLWGVVGYVVARRTHEVGVRLAIGASSRAVLWVVMRDAARATAVGASTAVVVSWWLSRLLENLVYEVPARDLPTLIAAPAALLILALLTAAVPARRATRLLPSVALRAE